MCVYVGAEVSRCQGAMVLCVHVGARVPGCQGARVPGCQGARVSMCVYVGAKVSWINDWLLNGTMPNQIHTLPKKNDVPWLFGVYGGLILCWRSSWNLAKAEPPLRRRLIAEQLFRFYASVMLIAEAISATFTFCQPCAGNIWYIAGCKSVFVINVPAVSLSKRTSSKVGGYLDCCVWIGFLLSVVYAGIIF